MVKGPGMRGAAPPFLGNYMDFSITSIRLHNKMAPSLLEDEEQKNTKSLRTGNVSLLKREVLV